ncbi:hypothetical protein AbraIFM66951_001556 [Aspergillus brasiliensis]|uniref:Uncharacterized protein n=2 Tax=Aspergillus brasiliensis TaxID=319629 RepID=A0A1L9UI61_ASPBC|nr:hypothetical protein ASPBRDRAFT_126591 [Aspergillus brasiliensis CBS 101740]GKZ25697.1 hypothetical protein AbraCBS73388_001341 [Aspergillus brasiliensis]GKZ31704.1 hypothetical protein AbraIFM66950_000435 [Aspergillus brasiliensis]GKZ49156.1 hypothetical protein AbraIFM66951_001556 [Aspergillus brasiliensis]
MAAQGPSPLPPTTILSSKPISQSAAHDFLAAYLDRAATDPALQPNAGISEHGPTSRTTAAAPNLILHNLKRVQAGLAGEVLGRDLALAKLSAGEEGDAQAGNEGWEDPKKLQEEVVAADDDDDVQMDMDAVQTEQNAEAAAGLDKEERKRKKKERRLAEKRAKAKSDA